MTITIDATYENGVLKPKQPVELAEGTTVRVAISTVDDVYDPFAAVIGIGHGPSSGDSADRHDDHLYGPRSP